MTELWVKKRINKNNRFGVQGNPYYLPEEEKLYVHKRRRKKAVKAEKL